ncbi:MAG: RagB/SusD family nutrient uptake outer membrane protein [Paludibacteraceae bacterium]|nr:RagB/SusD family nutrient uptake outer membrane protein [Paludibacteraceae bacterium]
MKKYISYILMGVAVICTGCEQFFSTDSPSSMDAAVFASPEQTEQTIAGIYAVLAEQNAYRSRLAGPWVMPGTDCEMFTTNAPDYAIYTMTHVGNVDITSPSKHPWSYLSVAIERSNVVIDGIEHFGDTTNVTMRYLYGEALTLRAWLNYETLKLWGDIPYMFTPMDGSDESIFPHKVDRNLVFDKIRVDLKHAAQLMPNAAECPAVCSSITAPTVQRMNREFALALLARVDLVYAGKAIRPDRIEQGSGYKTKVFNVGPEKRVELLNETMWACEEVIKADGYSKLLPEFADVFKAISGSVVEYNKTETLWEIPFADGVRGQFMNRCGAYANSSAKGHLKHFTSSAKSNAKIVVPPAYLFSFEQGDKRKWVTVSPGEWNFDDKSKIEGTSGKVLYQKPEKIVKMYLGKFRHEWMAFDMTSDDDGVNVPEIRFADVLLMYAEAAIGSVCEVTPTRTDNLGAQSLFDKVRARAGLTSKPLTMENLMQERAWEFAGEFIRKYDLMRWGVFSERLFDAQDDIENFTHLNAETGEIDFSGTPYDGKLSTSIYVKYAEDNTVSQDGSTAYRIDRIYGLQLGENDVPEGYVSSDDTGGWVKIDAYKTEGVPAANIGVNGNRVFGVGMTKDELEARQYWPIFDVITSANHNLYNDYGY